ncbi:dihydrolipoyllysine-residue acetyltransferase [Pseudomonas syringae]|nr:dihydrolipoyllysine-residue acetyltransferase [Pseudomonas syringae]
MSMLQEVFVPNIGDFKEVGVIEVLVSDNEQVEHGQSLIVVETDKAAMEIPAPSAGTITSLKVVVGDKVSEGTLIAMLEVVKAEPASQDPASTPTQAAQAPNRDPEAASPEASKETKQAPETKAEPVSGELAFASPSIRKLARELGVALKGVAGTGPRNRITKDDIHLYVRIAMSAARSPESGESRSPSTGALDLLPWPDIDFEKFGPVDRKQLSRIKKISGANLHRNWVMIPHVTNHEDADITELEAFRGQINQGNDRTKPKVTLLGLLMKAAVVALKKFPEFNASLVGDDIVFKNYYHLGFAVDTPNGLVVPVIHDVDKKGVFSIAEEMAVLSQRARDGKLSGRDMQGGSFTISSLGGIGGTYFTPIINAPEVAILGVSKSSTRVVWNGAEGVPRLILPLSLSWDHRVIDGAAAGRFNAYLASLLSDYRRLLM